MEIERGLEPTEALRKAADDLTPDVASRDERTLWRWVLQEVDLECRPSTNAEWRAALRSYYGGLIAFVELDALLAAFTEQESRETLVKRTPPLDP
jgi:hypothetical protein